MFNKALFYDRQRDNKALLGDDGGLDAGEVQGTEAILDAAAKANLKAADVAYILATAYHEVSGTMQPIRERGGTGYLTLNYDVRGRDPARARRHGNVNPGDGVRYAGRGFPQLTWRNNYRTMGRRLGIDLEGNPDLALQLDIATQIMIVGMTEGLYTGKKLRHYLPASGRADRAQFKGSRRVVNGQDKADLIAGYALTFQEDLIAAGWPL